MQVQRGFDRRLEALPELVAFTALALADPPLEAGQHQLIDFAIEELFTNMIKYSRPGGRQVLVAIDAAASVVTVTLTDVDVDPFDVTRVPDADVAAPLAQRRPGGLGLHLVRRMVSALSYDYDPAARASRTRFEVPRAAQPAQPTEGN
jgi:serine/threonine-protein kinase RsbW